MHTCMWQSYCLVVDQEMTLCAVAADIPYPAKGPDPRRRHWLCGRRRAYRGDAKEHQA